MLKYIKKGLSFQIFYCVLLYLSKWLVWFVLHFRNVTLFPVREHSKRRCYLEFVMHWGIFREPTFQCTRIISWLRQLLKCPTPWSVPWLLNKGADWDAPSVNMLSIEEKISMVSCCVMITTALHTHYAPVRDDSTELITCESWRRPQNVSDLLKFYTECYIL